MVYNKQTWTDGSSTVDAARLGVIEQGVQDAHTNAATAQTAASGAAADVLARVPVDVTLASAPAAPQLRRVLGYTVDTGDSDLVMVVVGSTPKMWLNEWGALRGTAPYSWGDALVRAIRDNGDGITTGNAIEVVDRRTGAANPVMFGVRWADGAITRNGVALQMVYTLNAGQTAGDLPAGLPAGTLVVRRTT